VFRRPGGIQIKTPEQLQAMRRAGLVVADALSAVQGAVAPGISTGELDTIAARVIAGAGARPSFLGYHGYPATVCVSVNDEVVHGIPGPRVLRTGDLVSIDCGAIVDGWHGDAAVTVPVGDVAPQLLALSDTTREALWSGLTAAVAGARLGDVGAAVEATVRAADRGYGILDEYVGHGIGTQMHMEPPVPNFGPAGKGPRLKVGMAIAVEPMVTLGDPEVFVHRDQWTVSTLDRSPAAHWEHTVAVTEDGPWVLTAR
jgi:methionyl aminopeptidase